MSVFRRNVRKYTALGLSRLNAMPAVVRRSDLRALVALYCNICHACQILDTLYEHCSEWLTSLEESQLALSPRTPSVSSTLPSESANATEFTPVPRAPSTDTADGQPATPGRLSLRSSRQSTPRILSGSQKEKMLRHNISVLKVWYLLNCYKSQFINVYQSNYY